MVNAVTAVVEAAAVPAVADVAAVDAVSSRLPSVVVVVVGVIFAPATHSAEEGGRRRSSSPCHLLPFAKAIGDLAEVVWTHCFLQWR